MQRIQEIMEIGNIVGYVDGAIDTVDVDAILEPRWKPARHGVAITPVVSAGASDLVRSHGERKCPQYRHRSISAALYQANARRCARLHQSRARKFDLHRALL